MICYRCKFNNSAYSKKCQKCGSNIDSLNSPLGSKKKTFLLLLLGVPFFLLLYLSRYPAPLFSISVLMILIPFLFYTFQYYRMKINGDFILLEISQFYIFIYYLSVSMLFIENTRWSLALVVLGYIAVHFLVYMLFIAIISRHKEWVVRYGIFSKSAKVDKKNRMKFVYNSTLFSAKVAMLTKIAKSDGLVSTNEAKFITKSIDESIAIAKKEGLEKKETIKLRKELIFTYNAVKDNKKNIDLYATHFVTHSYLQRVNILQELISIANIEGMSLEKEELIYSVGEVFRFEPSKIESYIEKSYSRVTTPTDKLKSAYMVLGADINDDNKSLKKRYRELVREYHPDIIQSKELNEAFVLLAKEKMQEINDAYELIKSKKR